MKKRVHILVKGIVQGVGFRHATIIAARQLALAGWVKNLPDGAVEIIAEGEDEDLKQLIQWCRQGPPASRVDDVTSAWASFQGNLQEFTVKW